MRGGARRLRVGLLSRRTSLRGAGGHAAGRAVPPLTRHGAGTAATGTLTATPSLTATPCAAQQQPLAVAVVLDRSGSMAGPPLSAAKAGAQTLLDTLDLAIDQLAMISFASGRRIDAPLSQDRARLQAAIEGIKVGSGTNIPAGIQMAHGELTRERRTPGAGMVLVLPAATAAQADGIRLISIGLGRTNAAPMQAIASSPDDDDQTPRADALVAIVATIGAPSVGAARP